MLGDAGRGRRQRGGVGGGAWGSQAPRRGASSRLPFLEHLADLKLSRHLLQVQFEIPVGILAAGDAGRTGVSSCSPLVV